MMMKSFITRLTDRTKRSSEHSTWSNHSVASDKSKESQDMYILDGVRRWSFRHRCLPDEKAETLMTEEIANNTISAGYIDFKLKYLEQCHRQPSLPNAAISTVSTTIIREDEDRRFDERQKTITAVRSIVKRSRKIIKDFKTPQRVQNRIRLQEIYQEPVSGIPDFLVGLSRGTFKLEPTFDCEKKYNCFEVERLVDSKRYILVEFSKKRNGQFVKITEKMESENSDQSEVYKCCNAVLSNATTRKVEIHGTHKENDEITNRNFILIIINDGSFCGPIDLSGIYRRKLKSLDKFVTWKIKFIAEKNK